MTESVPSKHKDLLNALCEMQDSPVYAARKAVLQEAELTIYRQEQEILSKAVVVPPGMALVPVRPSGDLIRAFTRAFNHGNGDFGAAWDILLSGKIPQEERKPAGWKGRGRIKVGARIWHDFQAFDWPGCKPPGSEFPGEEYPDRRWQTREPDAIFNVAWDGRQWNCVREGYGGQGTENYGNGGITVFAYDSIEIIEEDAA